MGFRRAELYFLLVISCRVGYNYWARGFGPWEVRASKKSARAISTADVQLFAQNQAKSKKGHQVRRCPIFRPKLSEEQKKVITSAV